MPWPKPTSMLHSRTIYVPKLSPRRDKPSHFRRSDIPAELFLPEYFKTVIGSYGVPPDGITADDCAGFVAAFADILNEFGPDFKARTRAVRQSPVLDAYGLHFVATSVAPKSPRLTVAIDQVLWEMEYEPAIATGYRRYFVLNAALSPKSSTGRYLTERFNRLFNAGNFPDALVIRALEKGMDGEAPDYVLGMLDRADQLGKTVEANPESKYMYNLAHDSKVIRGKLLWTMEDGKRRGEAIAFLRPLALRDQLLGPMYWYAKSLDDDSIDKEILLAKAAWLTARPIAHENERLHGKKSAKAYDEGDDELGQLHANIGEYYKGLAKTRTHLLSDQWLYTEVAKVPRKWPK